VFCGEGGDASGKKRRLYINVDPDAELPGLFFCHRCEAKGNLVTLRRHFGDTVGKKQVEYDSKFQIMHAAASFYHEQLPDYVAVWNYLRGSRRGLTGATIMKHQIGYAPMATEWDVVQQKTVTTPSRELYLHLRTMGFEPKEILATGLVRETKRAIVDSLSGMVTIPYHTASNVTTIRGRTFPFDVDDWEGWEGEVYEPPPMKYKSCGGTTTRLFNTDAAWDAEEIVVTEGEADCLVMEQLGYAAVGVPGAKAWQESWNGYLAPMKRIWLVFDRDEAGEKGAQKLVELFGPKARRVMLSPEGTKCDPTKWVHELGHTRADFEELQQEARGGGLLITVREAMEEHGLVQSQAGLKFGDELLDLMIEPGLQPSQLMIPLAKTGVGKTIWLLNQMHRMRMVPGQEDKKFLFVSLEQTRGEWWERARRIHRFYNIESTDEDAARWWEDHIMLVDKNRVSDAELRYVIEDYAYRMGGMPDCVFVDYLGYWAQSFRGERYERVSDAVMSMKGLGKELRLSFIVPHQVSRVGKDGEEFAADAARDSVVGSTLVQMADGGRVPIKDLVGTTPELVVMNNDFKFEKRQANRIWNKGEREVFDVCLSGDRQVRCTDSHPFFTVDGWERLSDLQEGDWVAVPRDVPVFGSGHLPHAELLGALTADGGLTTSPTSYTKMDVETFAHVYDLAVKAGLDPTIRSSGFEMFLSHHNQSVGTNAFTDYLRGIGMYGHKSPVRRVPDRLWTARQLDVALYLRGLWTGDGCVKEKARELTYASASRGLVDDVRSLLLRFGIHSTLTEEEREAGRLWVVHVQSLVCLQAFRDWIGLGSYKGQALGRILSDSWASSKYDRLPPAIWGHIHRVRKSKGMTWAQTFGGSGVDERRGLSRARALEVADALDDPWLRALVVGDLRFEQILSVEPIGTEDVFDISVVGLHNFIANDILVKNSGVIEETADFVITIWSPDNSLARNEEEKTGKIHGRIAKSRHGGKGVLLEYQFAPLSLAMVPKGDKFSARARQEFHWKVIYKDSWEKAVYRHRTGFEGHLDYVPEYETEQLVVPTVDPRVVVPPVDPRIVDLQNSRVDLR